MNFSSLYPSGEIFSLLPRNSRKLFNPSADLVTIWAEKCWNWNLINYKNFMLCSIITPDCIIYILYMLIMQLKRNLHIAEICMCEELCFQNLTLCQFFFVNESHGIYTCYYHVITHTCSSENSWKLFVAIPEDVIIESMGWFVP